MASASLRVHRPRRALEFGGGIGTITAALLTHPCAVERVVTTEEDPRFQTILRGEDDPRLTLVAGPDELAALDYLSEHGLPRLHTYVYVNWRRPSVRFRRTPKGCWLGQVTSRRAAGP